MTDVERAKQILDESGQTLVLCKEGTILKSTLRGVDPMLAYLDQKIDLNGYSAADKVVGKAAAFLFVIVGVRSIYARVISQPALAVLQSNGISVCYDETTEHIINRAGTDFCPMEKAVLAVSDPKTAYTVILKTRKTLQS